MKIKEVCEKTGLTDKAVRTYIKEGLVSPYYDENYSGRKSYQFTDEDVKTLTQIAVLRKYNFSLKEIDALFKKKTDAATLLNAHITEMKSDVNADINIINSMINVLQERPLTRNELCDMLNTPEIADKPIPVADNYSAYKKLYSKNIKLRNTLIIIVGFILFLAFLFSILSVGVSAFISAVGENVDDNFVGIAVITSDEQFTLHDKNYDIFELTDNVLMLDDVDNPTALNDINSKFSKLDYSFSKNKKININAEIETDKDYVVFVPIYIYEQLNYYGANQNDWAMINNTDLFGYKATKTKAKNLTYSYKIQVNHS